MAPSIEKMPSVITILTLRSVAAASLARRSSRSACLYTPVWHLVIALASRSPSMIEAWLSWSLRMRSSSVSSVPGTASLAFQQ